METPERSWSEAYWSGIDPDAVGAVPLESLELTSLPSPLLQRVVGHALHHLRSQSPSAQSPSLYFLSVLNLHVQPPRSSAALPVLVCRLWPSALFTGHREAEAETAMVEGMDLWYSPSSGQFIQQAGMEDTDDASIDAVAAEEGEESGGADCSSSMAAVEVAGHSSSTPG